MHLPRTLLGLLLAAGLLGVSPAGLADPPKKAPAPKQQAADLREQGIAAYKDKRHADSVELFRKALELNPKDYDLHRLIGSAEAQQGHRKEAYAAYKDYVRLCPKCPFTPSIKKIIAEYERHQRASK